MSFSNVTGRYRQNKSSEYPKSISYQQLLVLHVGIHYKLLRSSMGWWAEGYNWPDHIVRIHSPRTIKALLKWGLLEGNGCGEELAVGDLPPTATQQTPALWTSEKGRTLLNTITTENGLVFDNDGYRVIVPEPEEETDGIVLGDFATEREAALAYEYHALWGGCRN
jgi:hypothetical protein